MASSVNVLDGQKQHRVGILHIPPGPLQDWPRRWRYTTGGIKLAAISDDSDRRKIHESWCDETEQLLGHIPSFEELKDYHKDLSWDHRTLVKVRGLEADPKDGVKDADYLIYVCLDKSAGFERNEYLEWLVSRPPKVYGAAIVFKKTTDSGESFDGEIAAYLQNEDGEFNQKLKDKLFEERILIKLMEAVRDYASAKERVKSHPH